MPTLWFVQPVHGRAGLSRLCLEQRRRMVDELAGAGVEAQVVVIGDDANVTTARELGFHVLERPNVLGSKVNDGIEFACREGGADFVTYIGSDDWALASWFTTMPAPRQVKTSRWVAFVAPGGRELIVREAAGSVGNAPWIIPRALLEPSDFRPVRDSRMSGIDGSLRDGILPRPPGRAEFASAAAWRTATRERMGRVFARDDGDELRVVDFKGSAEQITSYGLVASRARWVRYAEPDPWTALATRYPADLVERMQKFYAEGMPQ